MDGFKEKVLVLHSGGLDSTVCLYQALELGKEVVSLGIDYNQIHKIENQYASILCNNKGIERKLLSLHWDKPSILIPKGRNIEKMAQNISPTFLQGRNILFLSLACAEAAGINASEVWIGVTAVDYASFPDCRPEFIKSFSDMLKQGFPDGPKIVTPLINKTKPEIAQEAKRLGLKKEDTWSCYSPVFSKSGIHPCNDCDACILNNYAWDNVT